MQASDRRLRMAASAMQKGNEMDAGAMQDLQGCGQRSLLRSTPRTATQRNRKVRSIVVANGAIGSPTLEA
ncbi:MAG: hypothetical protein Kow00107_03900 [Planctomycetota bacterium]